LAASFSKSFRGYDVSEVDAYVQSVENFETETENTLAKLNHKTAELEAEVTRLREIESSLFRALKLAEESQQNFAAKMDREAKSILDKATKEADAIKKRADVDSQKQALLTENERKQTLAQAGQELKEQERQLRNLQEAQKEIAAQLKHISEQTLGSIAQWGTISVINPPTSIESNQATVSKRGRKPGVKNKPKAVKVKPAAKPKVVKAKPAAKPIVAKAKPAAKPKVAKAIPAAKPKVVKAKPAAKPKVAKAKPAAKPKTTAAPAKRGPKPKSKPPVAQTTKPAAKRGPKPKVSLDTITDDGLPTLNKVLEAYAKSTGPRGKVGEIN
jgi:cell division initiation protein